MSNPAQKSREEKEKHPERYCQNSKCLWRIRDGNGKYLGPCKSTKHAQLPDPRSTE